MVQAMRDAAAAKRLDISILLPVAQAGCRYRAFPLEIAPLVTAPAPAPAPDPDPDLDEEQLA